MRGRKPKPTHLKLITGNAGRRPLNEQEPAPPRALPSPPPFLGDDAKVEWGRVSEELYNAGLLSKIDRAVLAAYCQAFARWKQAEEAIVLMAKKGGGVTGGLLITTSNGNAIHNPLVGIANKAMADMVRYAAEFGMTPSARSRIKAEPPGGAEDPAEKYLA